MVFKLSIKQRLNGAQLNEIEVILEQLFINQEILKPSHTTHPRFENPTKERKA